MQSLLDYPRPGDDPKSVHLSAALTVAYLIHISATQNELVKRKDNKLN